MFRDFFKKRKMRVVKFAELQVNWRGSHRFYSIIFFENDNGKREYTVKGSLTIFFDETPQFSQCETWVHTGLFPEWAKDPVAEKLSR